MACWPRSRVSGGCGRRGPIRAREVGHRVSRRRGAPQLAAPRGGVPGWEVFPGVNRALVVCLLGLLAGRMMAPAAGAGGGAGVSGMTAPVRPWERLEGKVG